MSYEADLLSLLHERIVHRVNRKNGCLLLGRLKFFLVGVVLIPLFIDVLLPLLEREGVEEVSPLVLFLLVSGLPLGSSLFSVYDAELLACGFFAHSSCDAFSFFCEALWMFELVL